MTSDFGNGKLNIDEIIEADRKRKQDKESKRKVITLKEYLEFLEGDSLIAQNSPARLLEVCMSKGVEIIPELDRWLGVEKRYPIFSEKLFGLEKPTEEVMNYFRAGAKNLSTGKQILLLVGPTASGKSTFVNILKRQLEEYNIRPVYAIKDCPMSEEPLHLVPRYLREEFSEKLGVRIEGDLCPHCRYRLENEYTDKETNEVRWWDVPVAPLSFSVQGSRGIGSFEPSDEKASDVTDLVGKENIQVSSTKGPNHPLAYSLSGELEKGNRGICEGRELIKAEEKLLWVFISVAEEKEIKVQGSTLPHISVDTVVIGHTNLNEYKKFSTRGENEALHDRIYMVPFPYPLRVKDEVKVYRKLISEGGLNQEEKENFDELSKCHIAPGSLEIAATFAVLTRLTQSQSGLDLLTKMRIYNGEKVLSELDNEEKKPVDVRHILEEGQSSPDISKREGMDGVSSRDVLAALNTALVKEAHSGNNGCLTPLKVFRALRDVFDHRMGYTPEQVERFKDLLSAGEGGSVMTAFKEMVIKTVTKAFLRAYKDLAEANFNKYISEAELYRRQNRKLVRGQDLDVERDERTGKPKEPDIKFLRSVEEAMGIIEGQADTFRGEILEMKAAESSFSYDSYPPLAKGVEKKLLSDNKASLAAVLAQDKPKSDEERNRATDLLQSLKEIGHCPKCAKELIENAREFLSE